MSWKKQWIDEILKDIPPSSYRRRVESELRDHMESQCRALVEAGRTPDEARAETLRVMGEPRALRLEYWAEWLRSPSRWAGELSLCLRSWAVGFFVMFGAQLLAICLLAFVGGLRFFLFRSFLTLVFAFVVGANYLCCKFRTLRCPVWQISVGLSFYWAFILAFHVWWEALDDHITFWEELTDYLLYNLGYYLLTLGLCVLLGVIFGNKSEEMDRSAAA